MDSLEPTNPPMVSRLLPLGAVIGDDLRGAIRHWATLTWLGLGILVILLGLSGTGPLAVSKEDVVTTTASRGRNFAKTEPFVRSEANMPEPYVNTQNNRWEVVDDDGDLFVEDKVTRKWSYVGPASVAQNNTGQGRRDWVTRREPFGEGQAASAAAWSGRLLRVQFLLAISFIIALGASSICGESEVAADAILCRGVSRWQYFFGKMLSRTIVVGFLFGLLATVILATGMVRFHNDVTLWGAGKAVGLAVSALVALLVCCMAASVWFQNPLVAVLVSWISVVGAGAVVVILEINNFSPMAFADQLTPMLRSVDATLFPNVLLKYLAIAASVVALPAVGYFSRKDV